MKPNIGQGDDGKTQLLGAKEKSNKDDPQVEAYGTLDELNSIVGIIRAALQRDTGNAPGNAMQEITEVLLRVQEDLFCAEAHVSAGKEFQEHPGLPQFDEARVRFLEHAMTKWEKELPELKNFILPGGTQAAAFCDLARTVSRRAERRLATFYRTAHQTLPTGRQAPARRAAYQYVNRLSDFFFTLERYLNVQAKKEEKIWISSRK